jgi:chorismate lyase/3-hydroxybenzoate synthase
MTNSAKAKTCSFEPLRCKLIPDDQIQQQAEQLLLLIHHGEATSPLEAGYISTGMPLLAPQHHSEAFVSDSPTIKCHKPLNPTLSIIQETDELLFLAYQAPSSSNLAEQTNEAYTALLKTCKELGFKHLLRAWNYLDDINLGEDDQERYRQFCLGRHQAFSDFGFDPKAFPAASALGHHKPTLLIYLIASKQSNIHIENPNQVSAYEYPREYGPKSPSFARATLSKALGLAFISGTASITGHQTLHKDDCDKQLELTLENIQRLISHIEQSESTQLKLSFFKVYIRHSKDLEQIKQAIEQRFDDLPCLYLQADICRADLLLEIEAICDITQS